MTLSWLLNWWNLVFVVPFLIAVLYLGLYILTGIGDSAGDADADADADMDADADVDADAHVDADGHVDADVDADADMDADADADVDADGDAVVHADAVHAHDAAGGGGGNPASSGFLVWLGFGRVPLGILVIVLLVTWGATGFLINFSMRDVRNVHFVSLPVAALAAIGLTKCIVGLVVRYFPPSETYAKRRHELLGLTGDAIFAIDREGGMVSVHDERGDLFHLPCRVHRDGPAIAKDSRVKLVAYNGKRQMYYVVPAERTAAAH